MADPGKNPRTPAPLTGTATKNIVQAISICYRLQLLNLTMSSGRYRIWPPKSAKRRNNQLQMNSNYKPEKI
jgi:hypothetical protein